MAEFNRPPLNIVASVQGRYEMAEKPMTTEQLVESLRALAEARGKATKGPWEAKQTGFDILAPSDRGPSFRTVVVKGEVTADDLENIHDEIIADESCYLITKEDRAFIALAANTISPALLEAVEGLVRENRQLREQLIGPQKQPASVRQIEAQAKSVAFQLAEPVRAQSRDLTSKTPGAAGE